MQIGNGRFAKIIGVATSLIVAEHILVLTDGAIAGRAFGSSALGAMAMILPMFSIATMISVVFAFCVGYLWLGARERSDHKAAAVIARQGFIGAIAIGFVLLGFATLIEYPYLNVFSPGEKTLEMFDDYWGWFSLSVIFKMFGGMLIFFVYTDGAKKLVITAYVLHVAVNLFFAYSLCVGVGPFPKLGMAGISLGTVIAYSFGTIVMCGRFFDRRRCGIRFLFDEPKAVAEAPAKSVENRYEVLRGSQMTLGDLDGVIELDRISLDSCYQVSAGDDYLLFKDNPENGLIIRDRATKQIVGYSMLLPIRQDMYEKIKSGTFVDTDFKPEMTFKYGKPGIYHLYFASVVVHPDHRSAALVLTMLDAMVEDFIRLTRRGIWFSDMIADVVSNDGAKFCRLFGLKKVCETNHKSFIYEVSGLPPGIRETTPATKKLVQIYRRKYETL